jgi:HEAT repeat protein
MNAELLFHGSMRVVARAAAFAAAAAVLLAAARAGEAPAPEPKAPEAPATKDAPRPAEHTGIEAAAEAASRDGALILAAFEAEWCGPCKALKAKTFGDPTFPERAGALHMVQIDVDVDKDSAKLFGVRQIPTLFLLTAELKVIARKTGFQTADELVAWIDDGRKRAASGVWEGTEAGDASRYPLPSDATGDDWKKAIASLGSPDPAVRRRAAAFLESGREAAVPPIIDGLLDPYLGVRIGSSEVLHRLAPDAPAVDPWSEARVREEGGRAVRAWWDKSPTLPELAAPALGSDEARSVKDAIAAVLARDPIGRTEAMSLLVQMGPAALPRLREAMARCAETSDQKGLWLLEDVRWAILIPDSVEKRTPARRDLARGTSEERRAAAERLGSGGKTVLPALRELVREGDSMVREGAVHALSRLKGDDALDAMAVLLESSDANLRMIAAQELGRSKKKAAAAHLVKAVSDPDEVVACVAIAALEEVKAMDRADEIAKCLQDRRWRVRATAAEVLGKMKVTSAMPVLLKLFDDPDAFVVKNAVDALYSLGYEMPEDRFSEWEALVRRHPDLSKTVARVILNKESPAALKRIEALFDAADPSRKREIFESLATRTNGNESDDGFWKPVLEKATSSEDAGVRLLAAGVIEERSVALAVELVGRLLSDGDAGVRAAACGQVIRIAAYHWAVSSRHSGREYGIMGGYERLEPTTASASPEDKAPKPEEKKPAAAAPAGEGIVLVPPPEEPESALRRLAVSLGIASKKPARPRIVIGGSIDLDGVSFGNDGGTPISDDDIRRRGAELRAIYDGWHRQIVEKMGERPGIVEVLASYITGDTRKDLPAVTAAFGRPDLELPQAWRTSTAFTVFLRRLPWPEGREAIETGCRSTGLYCRLLGSCGNAAEGVREYLGAPARVIAAVEGAKDNDRFTLFQQLIDTNTSGSGRRWPMDPEVIRALAASGDGMARAAAITGIGRNIEEDLRPLIEKGLKDPDPWVRRAAIQEVLADDPDPEEREKVLGPLVTDPHAEVAVIAAIGLLEDRWQQHLDLLRTRRYFQYGDFSIYRGYSYRSQDAAIATTIDRKPEFLSRAAGRMKEKDIAGHPIGVTVFAALLARYGDWRGLELELERWRRTDRTRILPLLLMAPKLTGDPRYLAPFREALAAGDASYLQTLYTWLKGVKGQEAEALLREVRERQRGTAVNVEEE